MWLQAHLEASCSAASRYDKVAPDLLADKRITLR